MIHINFFRKQKHGKIHVVRAYMEDPLFVHVEVKMEKQVAGWINCEREYVSAPEVLFAKLQVDA